MATFLTILQALVALPKIGRYIQLLITEIVAWKNEQKRKELENATIDVGNAKTKEERNAALKRWSDIVGS